MIKILTIIRNRVCPRRLYKYGTLGLGYHDDRTKREKAFDYLDKIVKRIDDYLAKPRYKRTQFFHSFFDISTGQIISSTSQIDAICKEKGMEFSTFREIKNEADKRKRNNEVDKNRMIKKDMAEIVRNVKKGKRSYKKEIMQRIKNNEYTIGQKRTMN